MYNKIILGYPNYTISSCGVVTNVRTGKVLKPYLVKGYKTVDIGVRRGDRGNKKVHRLVAEAFIPNPNKRTIMNHKDGNPLNNNVENLEWCDYTRNLQHAYDTELRPRKISIDDASELCEAYCSGVSVAKIAVKHDVSVQSIYYILNKAEIERIGNVT